MSRRRRRADRVYWRQRKAKRPPATPVRVTFTCPHCAGAHPAAQCPTPTVRAGRT